MNILNILTEPGFLSPMPAQVPTITTPGPSRFAHRKVGDILYEAYTPSKLAIVREIDNEWDNGK